ncbi:1,4-alpha-glucan branching enzyme [Actinomyces ruminicola]|uniref:1,4-alpha-glucan branching enzyme GlgB n=2 Tax=Actinomyces TaxID=1654 RepID=A0A1H0EIL4_9ACTO|nr:1,4-alpha-glucan branching protein GlgB [Actinomyces ruminicola]SDN82195.1 1,4-alpha-glucan branching enzyme [Actinomyces ruminicola]
MTDVTSPEPAPESNDAPPPEVAGPAPVPVDPWVLADVAYARYHNPHEVLGAHVGEDGVTIRTVRHLADAVVVVTPEGSFPARHEQDGVWVAVVPGDAIPDYRIKVTYGEETITVDDPYRFLPTLGEMDTYLISEGRHEELWEVLGAHVKRYSGTMGDVEGVAFAVWAPNARAVRVVGDFNYWDGTASAMRSLGASGVWELFIPGVGVGARYKFELCFQDGSWHQKADPMARATEVPPATASVVTDRFHEWNDEEWMSRRAVTDPHSGPMSVYEVHIGSWRQGLGYRGLADELVPYVKDAGFTHVEFMPVAEHPFGGSWGYQVSGYYAPTARFGTPDDFRYLVDQLHQAGIGVILDWVPAHFPKDEWALARFDGTPLYEDPDPQRGEHPDWGTYVFNFGRNEVRNFLVANALYWLGEFHVDGLRVDAVASMLYLDYSREEGQWHPNQFGGRENLEAISFLQEATATAYRKNPGTVMIAEESTAWPGVTAPTEYGGLGFGLKWNMGWMNDTLRYLAEEPINRRYHHGELTFSLVYAFSEQFILPLSHDEVVHGKGSLLSKMPGDAWQELAGLRALYAYQWSHPGKQLLFMGQEFGQGAEWNSDNSLDWWILDDPGHTGLLRLVSDLNAFYKDSPALWSDDFSHRGFEWIEAGDGDHNVLSYLRKGTGPDGRSDLVAVVVNFAGTPHEGYRVGLPFAGGWDEVINTDAPEYGGSGVGNLGHVEAEELPWNGRPASVRLRVPPMGAIFLRPSRD